jgi:hypothetical protein
MKIEKNPNAPHKALLFIEASVHEVRPDGLCSGTQSYKLERFPVCVSGNNLDDCIRKMNTLIQEVKEKCQSN